MFHEQDSENLQPVGQSPVTKQPVSRGAAVFSIYTEGIQSWRGFRMTGSIRHSGVVLLLGAALAGSMAAQDISGTIEGSVLDPSGAGGPKAKVSITNTDRNLTVRTITSDAGGNYAAPLIPVGTYLIKAEASGFKTATRSGIVLNVNDDLKINITLEVGAVSETVDVTSQAAGVELSTAVNATTIEGIQVRGLPLATRNYEQLVSLMPGVTATSTDELYIGNS